MIKNKGFTVTELLVVTAILSIVLTGMTIALLQQQRQFNLTREVSDVDQTGRAALDLIASEIRNAASRQGKTFSLEFFNGGSTACNSNTADSGSVDSPPDCISIRTWDIARGMERESSLTTSCIENASNEGSICLPSIVTPPILAPGATLALRIPEQWIDADSGFLLGEDENTVDNVLIGVRSRLTLCPPLDSGGSPAADCNADPDRCSECSVLLNATVDSGNRTATVTNLAGTQPQSFVVDHNFPVQFNSLNEFVSGTSVNGVNYGFTPSITTQPSEMTLVTARTYRVDPVNRELERSTAGGGAFQPIIGGLDAPGIVDLQFVFTLQGEDGEVIKVGLPQDTGNNIYSDFAQLRNSGDDAINSKDSKDIREVEIYLVVKSKIRPQRISGGYYEQAIPAIADVAERTITTQSASPVEPEEGFIYRIFTTTVYPRNMGREDFG